MECRQICPSDSLKKEMQCCTSFYRYSVCVAILADIRLNPPHQLRLKNQIPHFNFAFRFVPVFFTKLIFFILSPLVSDLSFAAYALAVHVLVPIQ